MAKIEIEDTPIRKWLIDRKARFFRDTELENGDILEWWVVNGRMVIVMFYAEGNGWDVYTIVVPETNRRDETLKALEAYAKVSSFTKDNGGR